MSEIRPGYTFDISAAGTVPAALTAAVEAEDLEGAIRNAVSLGGDADTLACIAGGIGEALHGLDQGIALATRARLDAPLQAVVDRFYARLDEQAKEARGL